MRIIVAISAFVTAMALSVAGARAMTIARPATGAGYFRRAAMLLSGPSPRVITIAVVFLGTITATASIAALGAVLGAIRRSSRTGWRGREGLFLFVIFLGMIFACYAAAIWLPPLEIWPILGPLLFLIQ